MNFLQKEIKMHEDEKRKRRHKLFCDKRRFRSTKTDKVRCGIKGCRNEAVTLRGSVPDCGQHNSN